MRSFVLKICVVAYVVGCGQVSDEVSFKDHNSIRIGRLEQLDSSFIVHTVRELSRLNWYTFTNYERMYQLAFDDVRYVVTDIFYSRDRLKLVSWIGMTIPNARTREEYDPEHPGSNRLCPGGSDTVYRMTAMIGFRPSLNTHWQLYPLNLEQAVCFSSIQEARNILAQYYFGKMKAHSMQYVERSGSDPGTISLREYGYNLNDPLFWERCWQWEKDTVGSDGLYPFQVRRYRVGNSGKCFKCAVPFDIPHIQYPQDMLRMYNP